jgi:hypothetical protein
MRSFISFTVEGVNMDELSKDQLTFNKVLKDAARLRYEKLKMYGQCYDSFGVMGISMRLKDKTSRIVNFYEAVMHNKDIEKGFARSDETVRDTLYDIINYAAMGVMLLDKKEKELSTKKDKTLLSFEKTWK